MTGVLAALLDPQEVVDFLAGNHEEVAIGEAFAFPEEHLLLRQPQRAGVLLMAVAVEVGEVDSVDAHVLEHTDEVGRFLGLACHGARGHGHVPVTREGDMARQCREAVAMRVA